MRKSLFVILLAYYPLTLLAASETRPVQFRRSHIEIPTYTFSRAETVAPLFKSVENAGHYPYTALDRDSLSRQPVSVQYESLTLENEYLRVVFLPELGGRIWSAWDKLAKREIFYTTKVIKPSRYNQRGAWPVGNLEVYGPYDAHTLTWPGEPWPWAFRQNTDGSATVILSHIDHFFRNKISLEATLYPGRAFIETTVRLRNDNRLPNRYLLWTNAGIAATEGTRFVYPMTKTIGHDSANLGTWPVMDGVDLSWYKNNKNMLGVFGLDVYDNFIAGYDYKTDYGTICYTNRLLARGVKTWTWGTGPAALRHMASYSDGDGPYIEVQSGRFVWDGNYEFIDPGKTDGWTEYWYGAGKLGGLTTANRDVAVFLEISHENPPLRRAAALGLWGVSPGHQRDIPLKPSQGFSPLQRGNWSFLFNLVPQDGRNNSPNNPALARLAVTPTRAFSGAQIELLSGDNVIWREQRDLAVGSVYAGSIPLQSDAQKHALVLRITAQNNETLTEYSLHPDGSHPNAVFAADSVPRKFGPTESLTVEETFQKGLGEEKFGLLDDAQRSYEAALAKDRQFAPAHLRLGLLALDRVELRKAVEHLGQVLERDPANGEAHYYLAVTNAELGNVSEARRHYFRLLPSSGKFDQRDYGLGLLALQEKDFGEAERRISSALATVPSDLSVQEAYAYLLRKLGHTSEAQKQQEAILSLDPTNAFAQAEKFFLDSPPSPLSIGAAAMRLQGVSPAGGAQTERGTSPYTPFEGGISSDTRSRSRGASVPRKFDSKGEGLDRACAHHAQGYLELATRYMRLFAWREAGLVLKRGIDVAKANGEEPYPLLYYYRSYVEERADDPASARELLEAARKQDLRIEIFPFRREDIQVLSRALEIEPRDANAASLLGDILYSRDRREEALARWHFALQAQPKHFSVLRDLGMALLEEGKNQEALQLLTQASEVRPDHLPTTTLVADLNARTGNPEAARQAFQRALDVKPGNDLLIQGLASIEAQLGNYSRTLDLITAHTFEPRHQSYSLLHLYQALRLILAQPSSGNMDPAEVLKNLQAAAQPPPSLGVDDFAALRGSRLEVFKALLLEAAGNAEEARKSWRAAAQTTDDDVEGEGLFRAMALYQIGETQKAEEWFKTFSSVNEQRKKDNAVELRVQAYYLAGIFAAFEGNKESAQKNLQQSLEINPSYLFARQALVWLQAGLLKGLK